LKTFKDLREELRKEDPLELMTLEIIGKLMAARDRKKMSQRELSKLTGIPQKTISRIENGLDVPKISTIIKIASALDLELTMIDKNFKDEHSATFMV
jgi:transcriptional regulator with XRE-family HTH domain